MFESVWYRKLGITYSEVTFGGSQLPYVNYKHSERNNANDFNRSNLVDDHGIVVLSVNGAKAMGALLFPSSHSDVILPAFVRTLEEPLRDPPLDSFALSLFSL